MSQDVSVLTCLLHILNKKQYFMMTGMSDRNFDIFSGSFIKLIPKKYLIPSTIINYLLISDQ